MTAIYHFTHIDNLKKILADGKLVSDAECERLKKTAARAGHPDIKGRRLRWRPYPRVGPAEFIGDYVPFYFAPRSPMLHNVSKGKVPGVPRDQDPYVYLVYDTDDFDDGEFIVTDGNAAHSGSRAFARREAIDENVDWDVMQSEEWEEGTTEERNRKRQAEFLVYPSVPWGQVCEVVTRTEAMKEEVEALFKTMELPHRPPVRVEAGWYFD